MNITITLGASDALLAAVNNLAAAFAGAPVKTAPAGKTTEKETPVKKITDAPSANAAAAPAAANGTVTLETLRALATEKSKGGKREAVKKLLADFNVDRVGNLEESKYAEFHQQIDAL